MNAESWVPITDWEDLYEVSSEGRVRSLNRKARARGGHTRNLKGRILTPRTDINTGHLSVDLYRDKFRVTKKVHRLVLEAFVGPCPEGSEALHHDDVPTNNHLSNLRWGTRSENAQDRVRNGKHHQAKKTECAQGHKFTPENTRSYVRADGGVMRACRTCTREWNRTYYQRKVGSARGA